MANIGSFDATQVEPSEGRDFTPIPAGKYKAMIVDSEVKPTSAGNGNYLKLEWEIIEGEFANRKVFANLNLDNPSVNAVEIARRDLSAICHACGKLQVSDSNELHDTPCVITVKVTPPKGDYGASNKITKYEPGSVGMGSPAASPAAVATAGGASKPAPWAKPA